MTIETAVTALSAFQGWSGYSTEGITAQLRDTDENVIAIFQLRYFPDANTSQAQLEQWDAADLAEASGIMRRNLDAALNRMNLPILKWITSPSATCKPHCTRDHLSAIKSYRAIRGSYVAGSAWQGYIPYYSVLDGVTDTTPEAHRRLDCGQYPNKLGSGVSDILIELAGGPS